MANRVGSGRVAKTSGRVTRSKLRRSAVLAVDGALVLSAGALAGLFATGPAAAEASSPRWFGTQAPLPTAPDGAGASPVAGINQESCISAVSCAAGGSYQDGSGNTHGLLDVLQLDKSPLRPGFPVGSSWSATEAPLPANANADRVSEIESVSCATGQWCEATGDYEDNTGGTDALLETYSGGQWTAVEAPVPADALGGVNADTFLKSISCPGVNDCTAVGEYSVTAGDTGLIDTLSGGQWSSQPAPQPADAGTNQQVNLLSVSCPSTGGCAAGGIYENPVPQSAALVLSQASAGGAWTAQTAPLPADALPVATENSQILGVSCAAGVCEAVGDYSPTTSGEQGLLDRLAGGVWTASASPLPANAGSGTGHEGELGAVSCALDGCVAVGGYLDGSSNERALAVTVSATGGLSTAEGPQPADAAATSDAQFNAVSCLSTTTCVAGGQYSNGSMPQVGLLDSLSGNTWSSVSSPLPGGGTGGTDDSAIGTVSCSSRGACDAGGHYTETGGNRQGLLDSYIPPEGYWSVASDGGIFNYGTTASFHGSMGGQHLNAPMVGMASTPGGGGYWEVGSDGGIFSFGNAAFHGSTGSLRLNKPIVGMAATPDGLGYWLVAADGGIFNYGDAGFFGSAGSVHLNKPIVGMAATPDGHGYWLVASDGGIFNYGDAGFFGSAGSIHLNKPVVGMASEPSGLGYWLVASDGGIFSYGDAGFLGSRGGQPLNKPIVGMMSTFDGAGYWLTASDGGIFSYGDTGFFGSAGSIHLNAPVVSGTAS
jgi:hypothetical protein